MKPPENQKSKFKTLLTGRLLAEIKDLVTDLLCIEHDRERRGFVAPYNLTHNIPGVINSELLGIVIAILT